MSTQSQVPSTPVVKKPPGKSRRQFSPTYSDVIKPPVCSMSEVRVSGLDNQKKEVGVSIRGGSRIYVCFNLVNSMSIFISFLAQEIISKLCRQCLD